MLKFYKNSQFTKPKTYTLSYIYETVFRSVINENGVVFGAYRILAHYPDYHFLN